MGTPIIVHELQDIAQRLGSDHPPPGRVCVKRALQGTMPLVLFSVSRLHSFVCQVKDEFNAFLIPIRNKWLLF